MRNHLFIKAMLIAVIVLGCVWFFNCDNCNMRSGKRKATSLVLIGVDGATWDIMDPLLKSGRLPNFKRLIERGIRGPLRTFPVTWQSPILWTSILTGKKPHKHGIEGFVSTSGFPVNSSMRQVKELGQLVSDAGYTAGMVGWWVSWPAEPLNGWRVSDLVSLGRFKDLGQKRNINIEDYSYLTHYKDSTYPEELIQEIYPLLKVPDEIPREVYFGIAGFNDVEWGQFQAIDSLDRANELSLLKYVVASDLGFHNAGIEILSEKRPEVFGIYYQGVDVIEHFFWKYMEPRYFSGITARQVERFGETIRNYYEFIDRGLGEIMDLVGQDAAFMIVSDHGMLRLNVEGAEGYHSGTHARGHPDGIIIMTGPGIRSGQPSWIEGAQILDVTPTLLYYLGIPVARDMDGKVLSRAFEPEFLEEHPIKWVQTHETGADTKEEVRSPLDKEILEKLRALGYLK